MATGVLEGEQAASHSLLAPEDELPLSEQARDLDSSSGLEDCERIFFIAWSGVKI